MLHWLRYKRLLPGYFGEALPGAKREMISRHVASCPDCRSDLTALDQTGAWLRQLASPQMPPELAVRLRYSLRAERRRGMAPDWQWRFRNLLQPFAVPASVGLMSAVIIFGIFIRVFEIPVHAGSAGDVPLTLRTPPRLRSSSAMFRVNTGMDSVTVKVLIDQNGRVADVQVLGGNHTPDQIRYLQNVLLFTLFDPATLFGQPTTDTVVLSVKDGQLSL
jgi:hypothetical protein